MDAGKIARQLGLASRSGSEWICRCPAHDDKKPSLTLRNADNGEVLWHCHAGCSQEDVYEALHKLGLLKRKERQTNNHSRGVIEATYDYVDADGTLLFQVVRLRPKSFRQRRPDGRGGWIWKLGRTKQVPYRLPELVSSKERYVFIVEGEKAVEALRSLGLTATCSPGGAMKWREEYAAYFVDRDVVILPDNGQAGQRHGMSVAEWLQPVAASVRLLQLPDLPPKGDPFDWIEIGGTAEQLHALTNAVDTFDGTIDQNWRDRCQTGVRGQIRSNHANVMLAVRCDPAWRGVIGFDEMRNQVMRLRPVPSHSKNAPSERTKPQHWSDVDDVASQEWLQLAGLETVAINAVTNAITSRASELPYHPVRDWLRRLEWDGVPRVRGGTTVDGEILRPWLVRYLGADESDYVRAVGTMWLISAVAGVFDPGCKADHILIFEGRQGIGKSTACRILCGDDHFSDALPEIGTKDASDHLRGKWIVELSELDAMSKADATAAKAFLSRDVDRFRPAYGRREQEYPRQCVFVGTTNKSSYLKDETGGRRYWPVQIHEVDLASLRTDGEQLWTEAVHLYREGHAWHITDDGILAATLGKQQSRYDADVWEEPIERFLSDRSSVTVGQVMSSLGIDTPRQDRTGQNRVTRILTRLGWKPGPRTATHRFWVRSGSAEPMTQ